MATKPLEFYTSDELIDELASRSDTFILMMTTNRTGDQHAYKTRWKGSGFTCLGHLPFLERHIMLDMLESDRPTPRQLPQLNDESDFDAGMDDE